MFGQKTKYEKILELKEKKLQLIESLSTELEDVKAKLTEAIINEQDTGKFISQKNSIENQLQVLKEEINLLLPEIEKSELAHLQQKMNDMEAEKEKLWKDLEPQKIKYEKAKEAFKKVEEEYFALHNLTTRKSEEIAHKQAYIKPRIDSLSYNQK